MTQWLAAAAQPEGLLCIAPAQTAHDLYHGWFYNHGVLRLASSLGWGLQMLKQDARHLQLREAREALERAWSALPAQYLHTPTATHPAINAEGLPTYVTDWFQHDQPGDFWSQMDVSHQLQQIKIPALHLSGWYDTYLQGSIAGFRAICDHAGSRSARDNQYLIAGPWVHIPWGDRIGTQNFGTQANLDTDTVHLRWFNHWLKDTGEFAQEPRIRYFAMNENQWHIANLWPSTNHTLYLHSDGRANSSKGDGTLTTVPPQKPEPPDIFVVDPEVPVLAPGGIASTSGCHNQAALEQGNNLLTYTTGPFTTPLHIFGTPQITLHATTSRPFADLVIKLICLRPNGDADFLCIGTARSTYLFGTQDTAQYTPDTPHKWQFDLEPTSWVFAPGESLRIEVAASAYPLFDRNPGTATKPSQAESWDWQRPNPQLSTFQSLRTPHDDRYSHNHPGHRLRPGHEALRYRHNHPRIHHHPSPEARIRQHHRPIRLW